MRKKNSSIEISNSVTTMLHGVLKFCIQWIMDWNKSFAFVLFIIVLFFDGLEGFSQNSLEKLIENTRENNKTLIAARNLYDVEVFGARTGNSPDNPEIEYAYLWGTPEIIGKRIDFAVTQSFDFPTAYSSRSGLSKINRGQASLRLKVSEQDLIVKAKQAWILAVYLNQTINILEKRLKNAEHIAKAYQRMSEEGEANRLQVNQSVLKVTTLSNEMNRLLMGKVANYAEIKQLNGGKSFVITDTLFPVSENIVLDTLINLYRFGPQNRAFQGEVSRMEKQKDVAFNQKLPKLKAGYYQESILGTRLKGIRAGITIPLWGDANAVKSAKAGIIYAQTDAVRFWEIQEIQVRQMYDQWLILNSRVAELRELLTNSNNDDLLLKALEGGEISLTQYYYEWDFYFQSQFSFLDLQRDLHFVEAELLRAGY